jgi:hypothetical protein
MHPKNARKTFAKLYVCMYRIHAAEVYFVTSTSGARRRARLIIIDTWVENK